MAAYKIEIESEGCKECGRGKTWVVVAPSGIAGAEVYESEDDAQYEADTLNSAFEQGKEIGAARLKAELGR